MLVLSIDVGIKNLGICLLEYSNQYNYKIKKSNEREREKEKEKCEKEFL